MGHGGGLRDLGGQGEVGDLGVGQNCAMADLSQTLTFFWRSSGPGAHQKSARRRGFRPSGDPLKNLRVENPPNSRGSDRFWLGRGLARPSEMSGGRHKIWHGQIWPDPRDPNFGPGGPGALGALDWVPKNMKSGKDDFPNGRIGVPQGGYGLYGTQEAFGQTHFPQTPL